jgi:hypothetical protein
VLPHATQARDVVGVAKEAYFKLDEMRIAWYKRVVLPAMFSSTRVEGSL